MIKWSMTKKRKRYSGIPKPLGEVGIDTSTPEKRRRWLIGTKLLIDILEQSRDKLMSREEKPETEIENKKGTD